MTITAPVIRYHGGKFRLASWVIEHFPPHHVYVEPFGGAAGVLMQKPRSHGEVYNDLDGDIVNLFRVLQGTESRAALTELLILTPYARDEFDLAWQHTDEPVERARRTVIRAQMGFGSAGASKGTTGFRIDCYRQYGTAQQLWARYPEHLATIGQRLAGVLIENRPAVDIMQGHDTPNALHYVDPPYMHDTRVRGAQKGRYYRHEMDDAQHAELLATLNTLQGMVVLSGYPSELYTKALEGWTMNTTSARISAGRGGDTRTECLWINPACMDALHSRGLALEGVA
ncbi:site-specific DNA-adenine methylase [Pseudomonas sp. URMO17WK12:I1]|uniref:DNA adenine methylase n=1 Tax=unclassified Pseudomonas TaxID=196821 RepID=UPI000488A5E6|nr:MULTISPECIES: DNA adenine methylase [unclassified Pseudomonas]PZW65232.1 site-specific DNA-adenine methylase [Pseudomonas sp. URMO17WK12:I1]